MNPNQPIVSRRNILKYGIGAIGTGTFTAWLGSNAMMRKFDAAATAAELLNAPAAIASQPGVSQTHLTPDAALKELMAGNDRFIASQRQNPHQTLTRVTEVAKGQAPFAAILCCADSRVPPEIVFDQGLGDLFVVRVAGNIATVEDIASEEYAVAVLGAPLLLVLGHERCGAVDAALKGGDLPGMINTLVTAIKPAIDASEGKPGDRLTNAVKANVLNQIKRLQTSPVIAQKIQQGKMKIVGGFYDLDTGKVELLG
jgi:carbonic anhydrase